MRPLLAAFTTVIMAACYSPGAIDNLDAAKVDAKTVRTGERCTTDSDCSVTDDACRGPKEGGKVCTSWPIANATKRYAFQLNQPPTSEQPLTDFPIMVSVNDPIPTGYSLFFRDSKGNVLESELEQLNGGTNSQQSIAWVKLPQWIGGDTLFAFVAPATPGTDANQAVWSNNFAGVWHMVSGRNSAAAIGDADPTAIGVAEGLIGAAAELSPTQQSHYSIADNDAFHSTAFTVSAAVKWKGPSVGQQYYMIFGRQADTGVLNDFAIAVANGKLSASSTSASAAWSGDPNGQTLTVAATIEQNMDTGTTVAIYVNGVLADSATTSNRVPRTAKSMLIGADRNSSDPMVLTEFFNGIIDEVRYESVVRDPAWIQAMDTAYRNKAAILLDVVK